MKILVLGASGATGRLVVMQLIKRQIKCRAVVREQAILSAEILSNPLVEVERGNFGEFDESKVADLLQDCTAVISCLGHNITFKGLFGSPRNLVSDAVKIIDAVAEKREDGKIKLILMSTTAYTDTKAGEKARLGDRIVLSIMKLALPPHRDNVKAADFLRETVKKENRKMEWTAVRPDTLIDVEMESPYEVHGSLVRSPVYDAGKTSRINVSHFMVDLLSNDALWEKWRFKMPVIYNLQNSSL
ncbi:MAG: SDR family oxidoreductase [Spirochaetes bacterium]|nr:SDR family oxidoreductase [Spirochaetota bacterium]